jgi:hypothetical protein
MGLGLPAGIIPICFTVLGFMTTKGEISGAMATGQLVAIALGGQITGELATQLFWFMWVPGSVIIGVVRIVLPAMGCSAIGDVEDAIGAMARTHVHQNPVTVVVTVAAVNPVAVATIVPATVVVPAHK